MPRKPRKIGSSGIYHVVIRGMDRQIMFEEKKDYLKYLDLVCLYKESCNFSLYAYCLMSNHVHLIIKVTDCSLETIFRKLNTHYAGWFNMKYQRTGHLQHERFYSEPIDDQRYLLNAIRYIHRNPLKAGLENEPGSSYPWSSLHEYKKTQSSLIDTAPIYDLLGKEDFLNFTNQDNHDVCLDIDQVRKRLPDDVARDIIFEISGCTNSTDFQKVPQEKQCFFLKQITEKHVSIRQLNRLTGIPVGIINRMIRLDSQKNCIP